VSGLSVRTWKAKKRRRQHVRPDLRARACPTGRQVCPADLRASGSAGVRFQTPETRVRERAVFAGRTKNRVRSAERPARRARALAAGRQCHLQSLAGPAGRCPARPARPASAEGLKPWDVSTRERLLFNLAHHGSRHAMRLPRTTCTRNSSRRPRQKRPQRPLPQRLTAVTPPQLTARNRAHSGAELRLTRNNTHVCS
jgi:hypothetical protein